MNTLVWLFRNIIGDITSPYSYVDLKIFHALDAAIDQYSRICGLWTEEDVTITANNITNGYFTLSRRPVLIDEEYTWMQILGENKVAIIGSGITPTTIRIRYKAGYPKFYGTDKTDEQMGLIAKDAYLPICLYALGVYFKESGIKNISTGATGNIKRLKEENIEIEYGFDGQLMSEVSSPRQAMEEATKLMRKLPNAQSIFFSTQVR